MPTIVTVHGTDSTGPEEGSMWWQKGSEFEAHIRELVTAEKGEITWHPVVWDGWNSETSRRKAGGALAQTMQTLENNSEPYSVIGHSHGGSVISSALMLNADQKRKLVYLGNWLTVGTPFIQSEQEKYLFTRLGLFGKATYVALLTGGLFGVFSIWPALLMSLNNANMEYSFFITVVLLLAPFVIFYTILSYLNRRRLFLFKEKTTDFASRHFGSRWQSFWHVNDEAIQGLKSLKTLNFSVFHKDFLVTPLNLLSIFILPFLVITLLSSQNTILRLYGHAQTYIYHDGVVTSGGFQDEGELVGGGKDIWANANFLMDATYRISGDKVFPVRPSFEPVMKIILIPAFFVPVALIITILLNLVVNALSGFFSRVLNPMTMNQIRVTALGSDVEADNAVGAREWPMWLGQGFPPLPQELDEELEAFSNEAAIRAIPKFRNAVRDFSLAAVHEEETDILSDYLTWDELVHTSYFSIPRFRKLIAYGLTQSGSFQATESFRQDPDYGLVAGWYRQMQDMDARKAGLEA